MWKILIAADKEEEWDWQWNGEETKYRSMVSVSTLPMTGPRDKIPESSVETKIMPESRDCPNFTVFPRCPTHETGKEEKEIRLKVKVMPVSGVPR